MDAVTTPPVAINEPIRSYAPGSAERASLEAKVAELAAQSPELTCTIGGEQRMGSGETMQVVQPHARHSVIGTLNGGRDVMAKMQASGMTEPQARAAVERLVDAQAATVGANHVFMIAAGILFVAAWLTWLAPRPTGNFMSGAGGGH